MYIILDNGHGGILNNTYQTKGKRSPKWPDGSQLFEGVFNRNIVKKLAGFLCCSGIDYEILVPEEIDIPLGERVKRTNEIYKKHKDAVLISIHANGHTNQQANGFEVFTSRGNTKSDAYAEIIHSEYIKYIKEIRDRGVKEAGYAIVKRTHCPALLIECGFMTNYDECQFLIKNEYKIAKAIFKGIELINKPF